MEPHILLAHSGFLRRLAREIVIDAAAADDVVQEAWLAAVERPPLERSRLGAWMAAVVRNLARRRVREDRRRRRREALSAVSESLPAADLLLERRELTQAIVDCLFSIDEPYRATILKRFYEDLKPIEIARETGVPEETVRTRLRRGLQQLRAKLERKTGRDRREVCGGLIGLFRPTPVAEPVLLGGLIMAGGIKLICLVAAVGALAASLFVVDRSQRASSAPADAVAVTDGTVESPGEYAMPAVTDRRAVEDTRVDLGSAVLDPTWVITGSIHSEVGVPISGASISLEMPSVYPLVSLGTGVTDKQGRYAIDAEESVSRISVYLRRRVLVKGVVDAEGWLRTEHVVRQDLSRKARWHSLDFVLVREPKKLRGRVLNARGEPVAGASFGLITLDSAEIERVKGLSDEAGRFEIPIEQTGTYRVVAWHHDQGMARSAPIDLAPGHDAMVGDLVLVDGASLAGVVVSSDGKPVDDLLLLARKDDWRGSIATAGNSIPSKVTTWEGLPFGRTHTDHNGRFRFSGLLEGRYYLIPFRGLGYEEPGATYGTGSTSIRLVLDRYRIRVHVRDELGDPLPASLTFLSGTAAKRRSSWRPDSNWDQLVQPGESWSIVASSPGRRGMETSVFVDPDRRDTEITIVLPPLEGEPGSIRIELRDESGEVIPKFSLSLNTHLSGETAGIVLKASGSLDDPILSIPPGRFHLTVRPTDPAKEQGGIYRPIESEVLIVSGEETELVLVAEPAARVGFTFHPPADYDEELLPRHEITARRSGGRPEGMRSFSTNFFQPDGLLKTTRFGGGLNAHTPGVSVDLYTPGEYLFQIKFEGFAPTSTFATLEPGKVTYIELPLLPE